jgi:hypothetical protein
MLSLPLGQEKPKGLFAKAQEGKGEFLKEFRERAYPKPFDAKVELEGALELLEDYFSTDLRSYVPHINKPYPLTSWHRGPYRSSQRCP